MNLTETYRSCLAELFPFWCALNAEQQERLKNALQVKCVGKNELVSIESPRKDGLILVLEGRLRVYISAENGREISILFLTRGDPFSIITVDNAGPFDIVPQLQATDRAVLAYIPKADFVSVAYCVPQASEYLLNVAARNAQGILNCIEKHLFSSLRHGVARALLLVNPDYRPILKKAGFLTRDPRMKERKKYGLKAARRAPQFSKR